MSGKETTSSLFPPEGPKAGYCWTTKGTKHAKVGSKSQESNRTTHDAWRTPNQPTAKYTKTNGLACAETLRCGG